MLAVDTDVVVRYVTNDDPAQAAIARTLIDGNEVRLCWSVLLETEWVLRSAHKLSRGRILYVMQMLMGLPTASVDEPNRLAVVLEWFATGMDFADAMHLACAEDEGCEAFATFDRKLVACARKARAGKVKAL